MKYKHILISTDLASNSESIAKKAKDIADTTGATLDIVHVVEHSPVAYGGEFSIPIDVDLDQAIETQAHKLLEKLAKHVHIGLDRQHVLSGSVRLSVIELADKLHIDLIIVGAHGYHGIDRLLGSRANAILHHAKCDVLAVRVQE